MKKVIRGLFSIIKFIVWVVVIALLAIILTQRLTDNKMSIAGFRIFTVVTGSMVPEYNVGDTVLTQYVEPSRLKVGDDITYYGEKETFAEKIVTHRIIDIKQLENGRYEIQTKGIANDKEDPKILDTQVYGKVLYRIKSISYINGVIGNLYGMYFVIIVPIAIMIFFDYMIPRKEDNDEDEEDELEEEKEDRNKKKAKHLNDDKNVIRKQKRKARRNKKRRIRSEKKEKKVDEETEEN